MTVHKTRRNFLFAILTVVLLIGSGLPLMAQAPVVGPVAESAPRVEGPTILSQQPTVDDQVNTVISLPADKDTYVASNRPFTNYGGADTLGLGYHADGDNRGALRTLLKFDFPGGIPAGSRINSAKIRLYAYGSTGGTPMDSILRHLNSDWNEFDTTWALHEPDWGSVETSANLGIGVGWYEWDITQLANQWMNGSAPNYGVIIIGNEVPSEHQRLFWSRHANNGLGPQMVVDFSTQPSDTIPPQSQITQPSGPYQSSAVFHVAWAGSDTGGSGLDFFDVQYREAGQSWQDWRQHTRDSGADFYGQHGKRYEFRVRAVDVAHNVEAYPDNAEASVLVDTIPPSLNLTVLPAFVGTRTFDLNWAGSDPDSGVRSYDVQFRHNDQPWQNWLPGTVQTSAQAAAENGQLIQYRVRAFDNAGNSTAWDQAGTVVGTTGDFSAPVTCVYKFPTATTNSNTFTVRWAGTDGVGSGIRHFDVRYRYNNGNWSTWQQATTITSAVFTASQGEGIYTFEVRGLDSIGNQGDFLPSTGASILYSTAAIVLNNPIYLPLISSQITGTGPTLPCN